ncbi:3-keto-5-aminohexanoate cleavage protein [Marivivens niveibacter]|uniref:3-dehydroshikimate dehydratase n=1 Tax=Marivivens niveibacter TaxID=1930667 RepID=A0A251WY16_9RHOB|nr:sugar phosphate isomerase/epimerase and 4-hydroxyphenylpyruvate domain-containing protein [Marivivens niveibacter]OUD08833.1 3-keto-5-aminohexanoate cleavage protein [Marivivens niveibacter]
MKTSIATVSISGDLIEKLTAISNAGFDGIEIFEQDIITFDGSPRQVGELAKEFGLSIDLFQPVRDFEGMPEGLRQKAFDRVERKFDLLQELGTDLLLISSSSNPKALGGVDRLAADFAELGELAANRDVRIGYEARSWGTYVSSHLDAWEVVRRADHPNVGIILDSFHTLAAGHDVDSIRRIPGDKVFHVQLSDAPNIEMDLEYLSRHFRSMPGEGDLDIVSFLDAVMDTGYNGPLSLEILNDQFRGGNPRIIANDGQRSLIASMDALRRRGRELTVDLPDMPAPVALQGVEFVEFAADEAEAKVLGGMLKTLGFAHAGQHISKNVNLYRQGDINIVINTEQEGYAYSAYVTHGTCVCDVGLLVDDAQAAKTRSNALGANLFSQRRGAGELDIPAVRGVGGSVLHLLDHGAELGKVWEAEFTQLDADTKGAGLTRIDHLAESMKHEELLTWTLFYSTIFDLDRTPITDVADPGGVVHSRALQSSDGAFRLTMNGVDTHRTFAGRFLADSFGSSVQHVAFGTDDIFATAQALADNGFEALPIFENYYADLDARGVLDDATMDRLKQFNIMYDEDDQGGYFQMYSKPYGNGFFFEIVQRTGKYGGYGAPNAPYRTAALKRLARDISIPTM